MIITYDFYSLPPDGYVDINVNVESIKILGDDCPLTRFFTPTYKININSDDNYFFTSLGLNNKINTFIKKIKISKVIAPTNSILVGFSIEIIPKK